MLKTLNMALIRCPAGISEEIIAVFILKKIDTENDKKKLETFHFSKFLRIFGQIVDRLRELEKFKGPTRKKLVVQ